MELSAENVGLWNLIIQLGIISLSLIFSHVLRQKIKPVRKSMMPTAVLAGFIVLALRYAGVINLDINLMESIVYHCIALGFISMSLRVLPKVNSQKDNSVGAKSGAVIVGGYLVQSVAGLVITLLLANTFMPDLFKASGILLAMGFGQGPGQANNVGSTYESLGFAGGRSFGLSIAAAGYLCACIVGVVMLKIISRKRGTVSDVSDSEEKIQGTDAFQDKNEIPVSDSMDKFTVQISMVLGVYLAAYLLSLGVTSLASVISVGIAETLNPLIWGFNFIIGSALALLLKFLLSSAKKLNIVKRQYQNNYLLKRMSGFFFDLMIVAGISSINVEDLSGLWVPFILLSAAGAVLTWLYLKWVCKKAFGEYYYEGLISMYGMLTGTIGSGIILLRELDPEFSTPASNNLVIGSSYGIIFGIPVLLFIGLAAKSSVMCYVTLAVASVYFVLLMLFVTKFKGKKAVKDKTK